MSTTEEKKCVGAHNRSQHLRRPSPLRTGRRGKDQAPRMWRAIAALASVPPSGAGFYRTRDKGPGPPRGLCPFLAPLPCRPRRPHIECANRRRSAGALPVKKLETKAPDSRPGRADPTPPRGLSRGATACKIAVIRGFGGVGALPALRSDSLKGRAD